MKTRFLTLCFIAASIGQGRAEELYDFECCPNDDCQIKESGAVLLDTNGYYLTELDELVRFDDHRVRVSRDGQFHVCTRSLATPDLSQTEVEKLGGRRTVKCLYVPATS